jgi:hypothetical protein
MVTPASEGVLVWMVKPASVGSLVWMPTAGALVSTAAALLVTAALEAGAASLAQAADPALWALAKSAASQEVMRQGPASLVSAAWVSGLHWQAESVMLQPVWGRACARHVRAHWGIPLRSWAVTRPATAAMVNRENFMVTW